MEDINVILIIAIIIIMILLIVMLAKTNLRSVCEQSDDFTVCDCDSVCVKPDQEFCSKFPEFLPYCKTWPQPLDIDCPSICETMVAPDARICYTAGALDSKDPSGKYTGPYEDCNKSIIQFCEKKKCKSFNPKKPEYICPAQCYEKTPQGVYPSICFSPDVCSMILPDGTWPSDGPFDQCNTQNVAELCKPEYGCAPYVDADGTTQQFSCPQVPPDMCIDTKCDPVNGICNSADGSCTCNPGWSGVNCTEPDGPGPDPSPGCASDCNSGKRVNFPSCFVKSNGEATASCSGDTTAGKFDPLWNGTNFDTEGELWDLAASLPDPNDSSKTMQDSINACNNGLEVCNVGSGCDWATCGSMPPPPADDCVTGSTWNVSGKAPCKECSVCQSPQIADQQCTVTTDTTCKDPSLPPITCPANCTKTNADGKTVEQCFNGTPNLCSMGCTYSDGVFTCSGVPASKVANCNNGIQANDCTGCDWATCP